MGVAEEGSRVQSTMCLACLAFAHSTLDHHLHCASAVVANASGPVVVEEWPERVCDETVLTMVICLLEGAGGQVDVMMLSSGKATSSKPVRVSRCFRFGEQVYRLRLHRSVSGEAHYVCGQHACGVGPSQE